MLQSVDANTRVFFKLDGRTLYATLVSRTDIPGAVDNSKTTTFVDFYRSPFFISHRIVPTALSLSDTFVFTLEEFSCTTDYVVNKNPRAVRRIVPPTKSSGSLTKIKSPFDFTDWDGGDLDMKNRPVQPSICDDVDFSSRGAHGAAEVKKPVDGKGIPKDSPEK